MFPQPKMRLNKLNNRINGSSIIHIGKKSMNKTMYKQNIVSPLMNSKCIQMENDNSKGLVGTFNLWL